MHQNANNGGGGHPSGARRVVFDDTDARNEAEKKAAPVIPANRETNLPLYQSATLALIYMFGCITYFLLIRYSKLRAASGEGVTYDNAAAVFFTELFKWTFSLGMFFFRTGKFLPVTIFTDGTWRVGVYYAVPSAIYALYNNLTFFNLTGVHAGTYQVFMQTRVLFTGVLYTWILRRALGTRKWLSLVVLVVGVATKYVSFDMQVDSRVLFMLFQASLSAFAGVYNEYLLKDQPSMDVNEQNFFMYSFSLLFNFSYGFYSNPQYFTNGSLFGNLNGIFLLIVINGAVIGIVTSLILKFINVIVKAFASACEVLLTAVIAYFLLSEPLTRQDFVACVVVMYSIYIYYTTGPLCPGTTIGDESSTAEKA